MSALAQAIEVIEFPESDGEPMAETERHAQLMIDLRFALQRRFSEAPDVYVGINMMMYWDKHDVTKSKAPDVFVAFGTPKTPPRRIWQTWVEGKAPDVVFEISSRKTWRDDMYEKWQLYARLGVREYFLYDPEYDYLPEALMAWRLADDGQFFPIPYDDRCVRSEVLGLELCDTGETLRLRDGQTGELLPTIAEETAARQAAELRIVQESHARQAAELRIVQESNARQAAETRAAQLANQLRAVGIEPEA
ncbi:MAG: Uma2 family endonuclease [Acidobacteria bacterium]|nr:Uma2 family endonuclease [Acidobacteriota bacterium]